MNYNLLNIRLLLWLTCCTTTLLSCSLNTEPTADELLLSESNFALGKFKVAGENNTDSPDYFEFNKNGEYSFTQFASSPTNCYEKIVRGKWHITENVLSIDTYTVDVYDNCNFTQTELLNSNATFFDFTMIGDSFSVKSKTGPSTYESILFVKTL